MVSVRYASVKCIPTETPFSRQDLRFSPRRYKMPSPMNPEQAYAGTPEIFSEMEKEGLCDGFLWPYEGGRLDGFRWKDGETAVRYETRGGTLYLRAGSHVNYGFEDEADFARAANRATLAAETEGGILTLGALRASPPCERCVYLLPPDCPVKLQFPVAVPSEEASIMSTLSRKFPGCKVFAGGKFLGGIHFPTSDFYESFRWAMGSRWRRDVLFLMAVGFSAVVFTFFGIVDRFGFLAGGLTGLIFVLLVLRFSQKVRSEGPARQ